MSTITATIVQQQVITGSVAGAEQDIQAQTLSQGAGISMSDLEDVEITEKVTGALMTYNGETGKFEVLTDVASENTRLIGGAF